jgi:hypothetical protein
MCYNIKKTFWCNEFTIENNHLWIKTPIVHMKVSCSVCNFQIIRLLKIKKIEDKIVT